MSWTWKLLRAGAFKLDGGAMFGIIPRPLWSRIVEADERNRITLQTNCLLLERDGVCVLIETGIGNKQSSKLRAIYDMEDRSIEDALGEEGVQPESINHVIVSHLHFDHAGGLTRLPRGDEIGGQWNAVATFPHAEIITQQREWDDALGNVSTMHSTYLREHLDPIAKQIRCVEGETEILDDIFVLPVPGHTWGQQAVGFKDDRGRTVVFASDLIPTIHHASSTWGMAYDVEAYTTMVTKQAFLKHAYDSGWVLVLDHEPGPAIVAPHPHQTRKNEFFLQPVDI